MTDTFLEKFTRCAKAHGLSFLDFAFRILIGLAGKLRSHGFVSVAIHTRTPAEQVNVLWTITPQL